MRNLQYGCPPNDRPVGPKTLNIRFARKEGLPILYHYQPFKTEWLEDIVLRDRIYFSNPSNFADPWDCSPSYEVERLNEPEYKERMIQALVRWDRRHFPKSDNEHRQMEEHLRNNQTFLRNLILEVSRTSKEPISKQYRVYCLTVDPSSHVMWANYANKHQGVCLGFGTDNDVFSGAMSVVYQEEYIPLDLDDETVEGNLLAFLTKPLEYGNEKEYRLVSQERRMANPPDTLLTDDNFLVLPSGALKCVILGCETPPDQRTELLQIVSRAREPVSVLEAVREPGSYQITIEEAPQEKCEQTRRHPLALATMAEKDSKKNPSPIWRLVTWGWAAFWSVFTVLVGVSPEGAVANVADWLRLIGLAGLADALLEHASIRLSPPPGISGFAEVAIEIPTLLLVSVPAVIIGILVIYAQQRRRRS